MVLRCLLMIQTYLHAPSALCWITLIVLPQAPYRRQVGIRSIHSPTEAPRVDHLFAQAECMYANYSYARAVGAHAIRSQWRGVAPVDNSLLVQCTGTVHARRAHTVHMSLYAHLCTRIDSLQCVCTARGDARFNRMRLCMFPLGLV